MIMGEQGARGTETQRRNEKERERRRSNMAGDVPCRRKKTRFNMSERAGVARGDEGQRGAGEGRRGPKRGTPNCVDLRKYSRSFRHESGFSCACPV